MNIYTQYILVTALSCFALLCTAAHPQTRDRLTVRYALETPSMERIKRALESRGGTFTPEIGTDIQVLVQDILQGEYSYIDYEPIRSKQSALPIKEIATFLASSKVARLSSTVASKIASYLPALTYTSIMKGLADACQTVHSSIRTQKDAVTRQDTALESSIILRTAHHFALETVLHLLFITYSTKAHPCERMHALYLLNTVHLTGSRGLAFSRFRSRANRFYFNYSGSLREYDPTKGSAHMPKRVKALAKFIKATAHGERQYFHVLKRGISYGIRLLEEYQQKAAQTEWHDSKQSFVWRYASGLFKEVTSIDVIAIRTIDPQKVFSHKTNKDLLNIMMHCSLDTQEPVLREESFEKAHQIILAYKNSYAKQGSPSLAIMQRFYTEACRRYNY